MCLRDIVDAPGLLLLPQLPLVFGDPPAAELCLATVFSRRKAAALESALGGEAALALEKELLAFPATQLADRIGVLSHTLPASNPALLRRPAAVVRHGSHVANRAHPNACSLNGANGRLPPGAGALHEHVQLLQPQVLGGGDGRLGRGAGGERRALAGALEAGSAGAGPHHDVALRIGDGDDGVVERGVYICIAM